MGLYPYGSPLYGVAMVAVYERPCTRAGLLLPIEGASLLLAKERRTVASVCLNGHNGREVVLALATLLLLAELVHMRRKVGRGSRCGLYPSFAH